MVLPADTVSDLLHEKQTKNKMSSPSHSKDVSAVSHYYYIAFVCH